MAMDIGRARLLKIIKEAWLPNIEVSGMQALRFVDQLIAKGVTVQAEPKTNADRIRTMSDEELAENLYRFCDLEERTGYCKNLPECEKLLETEGGIPEKKCICCLLDWLKQPAEVK